MEIKVVKRTPEERFKDALARLVKLGENEALDLKTRMELMTTAFLVDSATTDAFEKPETPDNMAAKISRADLDSRLVDVAVFLYGLAEDPAVSVRFHQGIVQAAIMTDRSNNEMSLALKQARQTAGGTQKKIRVLGQTVRDLEAHLAALEEELNA